LAKSLAYISWLHYFTMKLNSTNLKLATLWFDEIVFQMPKGDVICGLLDAMVLESSLGCSSSTAKELKRIWIDIFKVLPDYKFLESALKEDNSKLDKITFDVTNNATLKEQFNNRLPKSGSELFAFYHEVAWANEGLKDGVNAWFRINEKSLCTFLPTSREEEVLRRSFSKALEKKAQDLFSRVITGRIPDLQDISWDEIVSLRKHSFFVNFREKMVELSHQLDTLTEGQSVEKYVEKIYRIEMEEMVQLFRPSPKLSIFNGVASNLPLPLPINPYGIILSANDARKQLAAAKKYGWLYFLMDLPDSRKVRSIEG
jgi:hypothetical protein